MRLVVAAIFAFVFLFVFASAQSFPQPQDKYVNDFAGLFDAQSVLQLRSMLSSLEQDTTAEVVVVTIQTTEPLPPQQYRTELFNRWQIGKKEKDNGLLILYAVKEKRIEVEVGYGLEGILPDSKVGRILDDFYVPYRDSNQTVLGIVAAAQEFVRVINENADEVRVGNAWNLTEYNELFSQLLYNLPFFIIIFFIIIPILVSSIPPRCDKCGKRMKLYKTEDDYEIYRCENGHLLKRRKRKHSWIVIGGFGGGGFGGSGGGGFGGGGSGGGGAGR